MATYKLVIIGLSLQLILSACSSDEMSEQPLDFPPEASNCAADGPDCKQYNPDL
jgi:uncharacterized lipoprotein